MLNFNVRKVSVLLSRPTTVDVPNGASGLGNQHRRRATIVNQMGILSHF